MCVKINKQSWKKKKSILFGPEPKELIDKGKSTFGKSLRLFSCHQK